MADMGALWHLRYYPHSLPRASRPVPAPAVVLLGVVGLDGDTLPPRRADLAHRFPRLRHRRSNSSVAAVPAQLG